MKKNIYITYGIFVCFVVAFFSFCNGSLSNDLVKKKAETLRERREADSMGIARDSLFIGQLAQTFSKLEKNTPLDSVAIQRILAEMWRQKMTSEALLAGSKEYVLEKSIDDARQETNNIINKVNGWISFWIAMLAFIGGLIPALMAVKNAEEAERKLTEYKGLLDQFFNTQVAALKKDCFGEVTAWKVEVKELRQLQRELTLENEKNKIISIVNTIITSVAPSIFKCHANRKEMMRIFLLELHKNYTSFIHNLIKTDSLTWVKDYRDEVIMVLIHVELGLIKSRTVYTDCSINREFEELLNEIKKIIEELTKNKLPTPDLIERLNRIYGYFPALLRVI